MKAAIISLFQKVGRASLAIGLQNSHSGNMASFIWANRKRPRLVITRSGAQKGDLEPEDILFMDAAKGKKSRASSELIVHRAILSLPSGGASLHAHARDVTLMTLAFSKESKKPLSFSPLDILGIIYLISIPIISVRRAYGSFELAREVASGLKDYPVVAVRGHGLFARGRTLLEAFFHAGIADYSAGVWKYLKSLRFPIEEIRKKEKKWPGSLFVPPSPYHVDWEKRSRLFIDKDRLKQIEKTRNRLFLARLSPFFTGSLSWKDRQKIIYASPASTPMDIKGPLNIFNLSSRPENEEFFWHQLIYENSPARAVIRAYIAEAEAIAWDLVFSDDQLSYFQPLDVEGKVLHPMVPVLAPPVETSLFNKLLKKYQVIIIRGGGVWAMSPVSLSMALHHLSSLKDSLHYLLGLKEMDLI